jgi:hypothetical protein
MIVHSILSCMSQLENKIKELEYRIGELEEEIFGRRQEGAQKLLREKMAEHITDTKEKKTKKKSRGKLL